MAWDSDRVRIELLRHLASWIEQHDDPYLSVLAETAGKRGGS